MIDSVDRKASNNGGQIILKCKDFLIVQLDVIGSEDFSNAADTLELLSRVDQTAYLFPFFNRESFDIEQDGWSLYSVDKQLERLPADDWRISDVNRDFVVCPTYPERVIVPNLVEDESIKTIGSFRRLGRFPVLSYYHEKSGAVLMRSSQPMVGPNSKRCKEDERMINAVLGPGNEDISLKQELQTWLSWPRLKVSTSQDPEHDSITDSTFKEEDLNLKPTILYGSVCTNQSIVIPHYWIR